MAYNLDFIIQAAREDARIQERRDRRRQQYGRDWDPDTAYVYAVYRCDRGALGYTDFVGFMRGKLTLKRIRAYRKKAKLPTEAVVRFVQLTLVVQELHVC